MRFSLAVLLLTATIAGNHPAYGQSPSEPPGAAGHVENFSQLKELAKRVAGEPFVPRPPLPAALAAMDYDQYRTIQFRHQKAVWWDQGLPFWLETFHRGFVQRDRVSLYTMQKGDVREVPFSQSNFLYRQPIAEADELDDAGHAGIKVVGRFPGHADGQEMLTFLGSSYFRARSADTIYGASARGLAVDVALNRDEEFPYFKTFWVERPRPDDETLRILALMDSPSLAGAYRFELTPGTSETKIDVECSIYFRTIPEKIGIAPLTSMWIWGDGLAGPALDLRPAVHDSDGLLIHSADDGWTWRAFARQSYPSVSRFAVNELQGFGLLQRNRAFYHFDDHNAQYHKRPSLWVTPKGNWTDGVVELLELPGAHEGIDNIGAYWVPNVKPTLDHPLELAYQVQFFPGDLAEHCYYARATNLEVDRQEELIALTIRFSGKAIAEMTRGTLDLATTTVRGEVLSASAEPTETGDWIATVLFRPTEEAPTELTATLMDANRKVSETFSYLCPHLEPTFMFPQVYTRNE